MQFNTAESICAMLAVTYVVGAVVGAYLAHYMPAHWLHFYIGVLLAIIAVKNLGGLNEQLQQIETG